ncbi:GTPase-activating protein and VPS9 domain-containing protein 1 isoform X3 [Schistocerca piceifrons]|uniref:GTPase-activating protein and VPS9 domain-containing protein 1 isoform X3 n=1 Tax=Schistocerca piceifrons TaxID=274613 RepID=UPI001F5F172A|nr:GTPase-activating protein and VPS9 domain-containing protein 1 isoform X3 [Schistocerca piceifrons]
MLYDAMGSLRWDIVDLSGRLCQERLYVAAEQHHLQALNEDVTCETSSLAQLAWVTAQQRYNLNRLIVSRPDCTPAVCCQKANTFEHTSFIDGYKALGFQGCLAYGQFLQRIRNSPQLLAGCLVVGDKLLPPDTMAGVVHSVATGLLGSCILPEDTHLALTLLRHLTELQLVPSDNPRRLLRQKSSSFARLYGEFHEGLFSAKLFLTAALHQPIMQLLMEDGMYLDIDPDKATIRFPPEERLKKFGVEGTTEYNTRLSEYRNWTNKRLFAATNRFVKSISKNMHCFPFGILWLVRQIAALLSKSGNIEPKEVYAICTDLVFTYFICPAIVHPEPYGITDAPISYIARFNLMQVGQIVQTLAMMKYEDVSSKVADLYSLFEKDCVSSLLDIILEGSANSVDDGQGIDQNTSFNGLSRHAALFMENELQTMVTFLQTVLLELPEDAAAIVDKEQLQELLRQLPSNTTANIGNVSVPPVAAKVNQHRTPPETPSKRSALLSKVSRSRNPSSGAIGRNGNEDGSVEDGDDCGPDVLVIPFSPEVGENIGLASEQKVLCLEDQQHCTATGAHGNITDAGGPIGNIVDRVESQEKRTRFSLLHDEGSIGNTSDNLEAVSEAASNHSVASSLELENEDQNDNLSDMVSANVSGRGTPNISGRDTPSSQITEGEDGAAGAMRSVSGEQRQSLDFSAEAASKQSRTDIDDKFGKFEIKKLLEGDETVSMVSDTWSTDVLASDSETIEQSSERNFPTSAQETALNQLAEAAVLLDISETASEAWSTDVMASDSERMTEVDTDDTASVARSDDTARSEVDLDARGETDVGEETPPSSARVLNSAFRPVREEASGRIAGLSVPVSPTRTDTLVHPSWNVTGRGGGKADYRRRTMEYVDNNANNILLRRNPAGVPVTSGETCLIHVIDKIDKPVDGKNLVSPGTQNIVNIPSPVVMASPPLNQNGPVPVVQYNGVCAASPAIDDNFAQTAAAQTAIHEQASTQLAGNTPADLELKQELLPEDEGDQDGVGEAMLNLVRLSSASLASSSSSASSSDHRPKTVTPTPDLLLAPSALMINSQATVTDGASVPPPPSKPISHPTTSTGAIPKSISFDKTAERGDKDALDEDSKHKRGFFRNFKLPFKSRRVKSLRGTDDLGTRYESSLNATETDGSSHRLRRGLSEEARPLHSDATEDILAKYRRKPNVAGNAASAEQITDSTVPLKHKESSDERLNIDPNNIEASYAFTDAKRKLRIVLSTADVQHVSWSPEKLTALRQSSIQKENELVSFLQLQLAEAINLQDRSRISHLHETLRCIKLFDEEGCRRLFRSLREDYRKRSPYIAYLIKCRQSLLSTLTHVRRLRGRIQCDKEVCSRFLVSVIVQMFLERREQLLLRFQNEFQQLTLADEKTDLLDNFLQALFIEMEQDPMWQAASSAQISQAHTAIERAVISRVYLQAIYPNGDGDISRDQVLHEHMKKLSIVITPDHKDLRVPKMFHYECPWPSAQAEIAGISAYKTPRDKLLCVFRCATTIMNLLALASDNGVPSADDFIPVLVYVLIKANPPSLLSTIQYVDSFYGNRLEGEEQYWWIQFCSAIEFIKTMDYNV